MACVWCRDTRLVGRLQGVAPVIVGRVLCSCFAVTCPTHAHMHDIHRETHTSNPSARIFICLWAVISRQYKSFCHFTDSPLLSSNFVGHQPTTFLPECSLNNSGISSASENTALQRFLLSGNGPLLKNLYHYLSAEWSFLRAIPTGWWNVIEINLVSTYLQR